MTKPIRFIESFQFFYYRTAFDGTTCCMQSALSLPRNAITLMGLAVQGCACSESL